MELYLYLPPYASWHVKGQFSITIYFLVVRFEVLVLVKTALYFAMGHCDRYLPVFWRELQNQVFPHKTNSLTL
jgi:hypothetical protein